ncbi:hypothetical protein AMIS_25790 [Actinoplanes missouriensis 431]|uniref:Integral membrane protein n=1 Tax=Actinoplanes missouriensis (strain ATCC 14538 / DSM 43046 / CBS 188.64 / JCM 3121 / NBRC 102363 / NCIMB 12654 / NRRL B-3342 / UNCC 431) TaxID=512565 RepID=I0H462_ACTM4|nr:Bax inhibitor-1 family protein [Actinoplanes missouriensis]BAL87799.1 hypothetical protein AMIS_25790 [Actinoplanes missouriensis 431]
METFTYRPAGFAARHRYRDRALFAPAMGYVAGVTVLFAAGAYLGRNLGAGAGLVAFLAAFGTLIGLRFAVRRSTPVTVGLLIVFGLLMGLGAAPALAQFAGSDPQALWRAGGATALFVAGFGATGYAVRRDLSGLSRILFWALVGLIGFSIVLIFVSIPNGALVYAVLGLAIFAGLVVIDFQRLRWSTDVASAPLVAASIFLDILNVFLFFLQIFSGGRDNR